MAGNKRRRSDAEAPGHTEASMQEAIRRAPRDLRTGPPEPGAQADAHYRNLFATKPDFTQLGKQDPDFGKILRQGKLDFKDPVAVMQLTKTLLQTHFNLEIKLPDDRLCPPVMNRHNYILWLKGLMDTTSYNDPDRKVLGLDIGTGASCIYPLLACTQRRWSFVATDIDSKSLTYAKENVELNNLQNRISIIARKPEHDLISLEALGTETLDFVMTNPPFYESDEELLSSAALKSQPAWTACTGSRTEMVTDGGEVSFVGRILKESLILREKVQWYTAMFGKQSSLETFVGLLREHKITNYAVTEFVQGQKTRRWAIAWSFGSMRPSEEVARGMHSAAWKKFLPTSVESSVLSLPIETGVSAVQDKIQGLLSSLELISWEWNREKLVGVGRAREDVWSRAWRRKKMREEREGKMAEDAANSEQCRFGFEIALRVGREQIAVLSRWREGHEASMYESFGGFLKTRLAGALSAK